MKILITKFKFGDGARAQRIGTQPKMTRTRTVHTYLPSPVGGRTAHVVMHGGQNWDGLFVDIYSSKDHGGL